MQYLNAKNFSFGLSGALDIAGTGAGAALLTAINPAVGVLAPIHTLITYVALTVLSKCVKAETLAAYKDKIILGTSLGSALITTGIITGTLALFGVAFSVITFVTILLALTISSLAFTLFHHFVNTDILGSQKKSESGAEEPSLFEDLDPSNPPVKVPVYEERVRYEGEEATDKIFGRPKKADRVIVGEREVVLPPIEQTVEVKVPRKNSM